MTRLTLLLALAAVPAATSGPAQEPPSSLHPPRGVPGTLRLAHSHDRTTACQARGGRDPLDCEAQTEVGRAGTSLALQPIDAAGAEDDTRSAVEVTFDNAAARVELSRDLPAGLWQLDWSGLPKGHRFVIDEGESLRISLHTTTGACEVSDKQCVLRPAKVTKTAEIPEANRAP